MGATVQRYAPGTWIWVCTPCFDRGRPTYGYRTNQKDAFLAAEAHLKERHRFWLLGKRFGR